MSQDLRTTPSQDQHARFNEGHNSDRKLSANDARGDADFSLYEHDAVYSEQDSLAFLKLLGVDSTLDNDSESARPTSNEFAGKKSGVDPFAARYASDIQLSQEASKAGEKVFSEITKATLGQDVKFSIEFSAGRSVDVVAYEFEDRWSINFAARDIELRKKLQKCRERLEKTLSGDIGKVVIIDVK